MSKYVVFDLDGCLINSEHRIHYIEEKNWEAYEKAIDLDTMYPEGVAICRAMMAAGHPVLFLTSRMEKYRTKTLQKLRENISYTIQDDDLLMRPPHILGYDNGQPNIVVMHDTEFKPYMLKTRAGVNLGDILFVYEDRDSMVSRWRELGVVCIQPRAGDW